MGEAIRTLRYHYSFRLRTLLGESEMVSNNPEYVWGGRGEGASLTIRAGALSPASDYRGKIQVGSLTGAVHLSNDNAGVPRPAQRERKSRVEHKGLSWLDPGSQYEHGP